jgi:hypothetical protein
MRSLQAQVAQQSGWGPPPPGPGMPTAGLHMAGHPAMLGPPQVKGLQLFLPLSPTPSFPHLGNNGLNQSGVQNVRYAIQIVDNYSRKDPVLRIRIRIRIHRIHVFLGLLDPDPLVRCMDPDPSIIKQK